MLLSRVFTRYYFPPPLVSQEGYRYAEKYASYSEHNYLAGGVASFLRSRHFEHALRLTRECFHKANVIDFGCGDGPFLPSLSRYFNHVLAIDRAQLRLNFASEVVKAAHLSNVEIMCNDNLSFDYIRSEIATRQYQVLYLMETLEHIGDKSDPWISRVNFVKELSGLVDPDGVIVLSVPNMIGISFLLQRLGFFLLNQRREPISKTDLLKVSLFNDTSNLEKQWKGTHLGFNHKKLENELKRHIPVLKKRNIGFHVIYVLKACPI